MTTVPVRVRPATEADAPGIRMVATTAWPATYKDAWSPENISQFLGRAYSLAQIRARITYPGRGTFVAERNMPPHVGAIVGYAFAGPRADAPESDAGELYAIYTLTDVHGKGVGYRLWQAVTAWLKEQGKRHMWIGVLAVNQHARAFYERQGAVLDHLGDVTIGTQTLSEAWYLYDL